MTGRIAWIWILLSVPPGPFRSTPELRRAFVLSLIGGIGILGITLFLVAGTVGRGGREATTLFLLFPHLLTGSLALAGALMMRVKPAKTRRYAQLVAGAGIASIAFFGWASLLILVAAIFATLDGLIAYREAS